VPQSEEENDELRRYGVWRRVVGLVFPDVSKDTASSSSSLPLSPRRWRHYVPSRR